MGLWARWPVGGATQLRYESARGADMLEAEMLNLIQFPDWVPTWAQLPVLIVGILLGLAFLLMPFSVFGVKSRLEAVEARLDEIQGDIRALALRLPEASRGRGYDDEPLLRPVPLQDRAGPAARPPIPPVSWAQTPSRQRMEPRI